MNQECPFDDAPPRTEEEEFGVRLLMDACYSDVVDGLSSPSARTQQIGHRLIDKIEALNNERLRYGAALDEIAALRPGAGSSKLHRVVEIARRARLKAERGSSC